MAELLSIGSIKAIRYDGNIGTSAGFDLPTPRYSALVSMTETYYKNSALFFVNENTVQALYNDNNAFKVSIDTDGYVKFRTSGGIYSCRIAVLNFI